MLDYLDADIAFWKSINKMSNRKHYLYTLLWFMIYSTRFRKKVFNPLKSNKLTNIKKVPLWFCYLSSLTIILICKIVRFKRKLIPATWF